MIRAEYFTSNLPLVPFPVITACIPLSYAREGWQKNRLESGYSVFGAQIITQLLERERYEQVELKKEVNGMPYVSLADGSVLHLSISHTKTHYWVALGGRNRIGLDAEVVSRSVKDTLIKRMQHPDEPSALRIPAIQLWTIKEAVLKLLGTGLRTPMNELNIARVTDILFQTTASDRQIRIVSQVNNGHWLSHAFYHTKFI
ncbi:MAG: 4'-phosphopantetheinyl transferase AcpT [Bacteroidetes bacterium HLUCCA01]|nr:MAG: 4'-phosphopantetheinyl transferase AcpT [Bacteroidetes bacterium HLUCCA01]